MTFQKINLSKVVTLLSVGKIEEQVIAGKYSVDLHGCGVKVDLFSKGY